MTVKDLIAALQQYIKAAPENAAATVCVRAPDGETCFTEFDALNGVGLPGQHFLTFAPRAGMFKTKDVMKVN